MTSDCRNRITPSEAVTEEQVALLSFTERILDFSDVIRTVRCGYEDWMVAA